MPENRITEDSTLEEILKYQGSASILMRHGVPCPTCPLARYEIARLKIGEIARMYNVDVKSLMKELNEAIKVQ